MPKGLVRYQQCGCFHFITFGCYHCFERLGTATAQELFEHSLETMRLRYDFVVSGYVVMPDHVHLLVSEPIIDPGGPVTQSRHAVHIALHPRLGSLPETLLEYCSPLSTWL